MKRALLAFTAGLLFAVGLGVGGMTRPSKVLGFLDLAGAWDPSLLLVMVGGISVFGVAYWSFSRRKTSLFGDRLQVPPRGRIDRKLMVGAVLFGIGWGLAGFCPGPGLVGAAGGAPGAVTFIVAMLGGQILQAFMAQRGGVMTRFRKDHGVHDGLNHKEAQRAH